MSNRYTTTDMTGEAMQTASAACGWNFIVLMSRQGKIRLSEFFSSYSEGEKRRLLRDISADILPRAPKMCNIIEKGAYKFVYRRYASLYFVVGIPEGMNELLVLEQIHLFVEALDGYFNSGKSFCTCPDPKALSCLSITNCLSFYSVRARLGLFPAQVALDSF
jgi:hypothetical protein